MVLDVVVTAIVFFGLYHMMKLLTEFLLKRKIVKAGHIDKAGILEPPKQDEEINRYPSLKWGLVALMTGLGFILIEVLRQVKPTLVDYQNSALPIGILLVFMSLGFLIYFFIMNRKKM